MQPPVTPPLRVAVVGGGMAGLAAARDLNAAGASVVVLEGASQPGGKLRRSEVGGVVVDEGADSMLRRVPYGAELAGSLGLELIEPTTGAFLWTRGALRPLPAGGLMGVPADLRALARSRVLSAAGLVRVPLDLALPGAPVTRDVTVGSLVSRRMGREVTQRLVDPLLGGVYAGRADRLSLQATLPQLWTAVQGNRSLTTAARQARGQVSPGPVFAGLAGGLAQLADAAAAGLDVRVDSAVTRLERLAQGWRLVTRAGLHEADVVVLAVPAAPAARLLAGHAGASAVAGLAAVEYASVGIVTLVLHGPSPGAGTGYLVPAVDGRVTKAVTFTSRKWGMAGPAVVRASVGRFGDVGDLQRDDDDLVRVVLQELATAVGPLPPLIASRVTRWGGALPQYAVGHVDRVAQLRAALPAGIAVAGAAYDGVGVPAVIRSGQQAGRSVLEGLR